MNVYLHIIVLAMIIAVAFVVSFLAIDLFADDKIGVKCNDHCDECDPCQDFQEPDPCPTMESYKELVLWSDILEEDKERLLRETRSIGMALKQCVRECGGSNGKAD